ncbi:MAG: hypothetical protein Ct9H300mP1_07920 [Planctomycetaceae bacterium]|nr:MAG: hypothetical protein Ct9H300mP1_07920 [Planctomycetaceae bacterium]
MLHGICYDFFFVTGPDFTPTRQGPEPIRAQAQGLLVLFTLGLGMFIGAKIAAEVETRYTTEESIAQAEEVKALGEKITTATEAGDDALVTKLTAEKTTARHDELAAINWRNLWGIPAILAAVILVGFCVVFHERTDSPTSAEPADTLAAAAEDPSQ